jgi:hypothetical protein
MWWIIIKRDSKNVKSIKVKKNSRDENIWVYINLLKKDIIIIWYKV